MNAPRLPHLRHRIRILVCAGVGGAAAGVSGPFALWQLTALIGWVAFAVALLGWVWFEVSDCDATNTRERATVVDPTRAWSATVVAVASVMSLAAVGFGLAEARERSGALAVALTVLSLLSVVLSWLTVHSMFILRYAHEYYSGPVGGIEFPGGEEPDYRDFAYFAFTIGVAFAVSDTPVPGRVVRRIVYRQAMVSYFFGAIIVGLAINVMAGFVR